MGAQGQATEARRVLWLAYHFPPVGGGGVQRSLKFVRHLRGFGYEPVVVTGPGTARRRWTPRDQELEEEIPAGTTVARLPEPEPVSAGRSRRRLERWLRLEPGFSRWWREGAVAVGRRLAPVDVVYASMSPFETAWAAAELGGLLGRPWVADLRDPWALDEMTVYPTRVHRLRELSRMRVLLRSADAVVMNTPEAEKVLREHFPELELVVTIPNGFDEADFAGPPPERKGGAFRIVHTGTLHAELGAAHRRSAGLRRLLGGSLGSVDILARSHVHLLEAVERVIAARPDLRSLVEVHLAGALSDADRALLQSRAVEIRAHGYLSHSGTIALIRSADLLFLPMHDLSDGRRAGIVPGKTYEYLASGRPILAAVPEGDARDLLARAETAILCRPADVDAIAAVVAREADRFRAEGRVPTRRPKIAHEYERRLLTRRLAAVFDAVVGGPGDED